LNWAKLGDGFIQGLAVFVRERGLDQSFARYRHAGHQLTM
jgi:hypothetical protein